MKAHPLAEMFPVLEDCELKELAADIKANGLRQHIVVLDGMILDGRNRERACQLARINPTFTPFKGDDPLAFVLSVNLHRRHLSASQRAMIAAELSNLKNGQKTSSANLPSRPVTQPEAAAKLKVSERSVRDAKKLIEEKPDAVAAVKAGEKTIHAALAEPKQEAQPEIIHDLTDMHRELPAKNHERWIRAEKEAKELLALAHKLKSAMKAGVDGKEENVVWVDLHNTDVSSIQQVINSLQLTLRPFAVCYACNGTRPEKCRLCRGRGFVGKHLWTTCPDETKQMIAKQVK